MANPYTMPAQSFQAQSQFIPESEGYTPIPFNQMVAAGNILENRTNQYNETESAIYDLIGSVKGVGQTGTGLPGGSSVNLGQDVELQNIIGEFQSEIEGLTETTEPWRLGQLGKLKGKLNKFKKEMSTGRIADIAHNQSVMDAYAKLRQDSPQLVDNPELGMSLENQFQKEVREIQNGTRTRLSAPGVIGEGVNVNEELFKELNKMAESHIKFDENGNQISGISEAQVMDSASKYIASSPHLQNAIAQRAMYIAQTQGIDPKLAAQQVTAGHLQAAASNFAFDKLKAGKTGGQGGSDKYGDDLLGLESTFTLEGGDSDLTNFRAANDKVNELRGQIENTKDIMAANEGNARYQQEGANQISQLQDELNSVQTLMTSYGALSEEDFESLSQEDILDMSDKLDLGISKSDLEKSKKEYEEALKRVEASTTRQGFYEGAGVLPGGSLKTPYQKYLDPINKKLKENAEARGVGVKFRTINNKEFRDDIGRLVASNLNNPEMASSLMEVIEGGERSKAYDPKDLKDYNTKFGSGTASEPSIDALTLSDYDGVPKIKATIYKPNKNGEPTEPKTVLIPLGGDFINTMADQGYDMGIYQEQVNLSQGDGPLSYNNQPASVSEPVNKSVKFDGGQTATTVASINPFNGQIEYSIKYKVGDETVLLEGLTDNELTQEVHKLRQATNQKQ